MWQRIIDEETSRRCWDAIEEIEAALRTGPPPTDPLLAGGTAGQAVFFAYLDAAREGSDAGDQALDRLGQSIDALAEAQLLPSLYSGFCGIGWAVEHLTREFYEGDEDLTSEIDAALRQLLDGPAETLHYELIAGLAGYGMYLVERLPHPEAEALLGRIVDRLEKSMEETPEGLTWHTELQWIPEWQRESLPRGCYNLGVAHGVPGVLGFLAEARRAGISDPRIPRLADGLVRWMFANRLPAGGETVFPSMVVPGEEPEPTRTAWCYGDLGIAAVLLSAARSFDRADWAEEALELARLAARRPLENIKAIDAGLCHGAAGNAHIFLRLHQATGDPEIRDAALFWLRRTLAMRQPGQGCGGYQAWTSEGLPGTSRWTAESGFLVGSAGIGLALLGAVSEIEPSWDRVLLTSVPPRSGDGGNGEETGSR